MFNTPWYQTESEKLAFTCYAVRTQVLDDAICELARDAVTSEPTYQRQAKILASYGIDIDYLTSDEIAYIEREVQKRME